MIGIPLFGDQFYNIDCLVKKGVTIRLDLGNISEKSLDSALHALLHNSEYRQNALNKK